MRTLVTCDFDHTLSEAHWRDWMIPLQTWDDYHAASIDDHPVEDMVRLVNGLTLLGYKVVGHTARDERWRGLTLQWCQMHHVNIDQIIMRPNGDYRPSWQQKVEQIKTLCAPNEPHEVIAFAIDDNEEIINAYREMGVNVLQVWARNDRRPHLTNEQRAQAVLESCYAK